MPGIGSTDTSVIQPSVTRPTDNGAISDSLRHQIARPRCGKLLDAHIDQFSGAKWNAHMTSRGAPTSAMQPSVPLAAREAAVGGTQRVLMPGRLRYVPALD